MIHCPQSKEDWASLQLRITMNTYSSLGYFASSLSSWGISQWRSQMPYIKLWVIWVVLNHLNGSFNLPWIPSNKSKAYFGCLGRLCFEFCWEYSSKGNSSGKKTTLQGSTRKHFKPAIAPILLKCLELHKSQAALNSFFKHNQILSGRKRVAIFFQDTRLCLQMALFRKGGC